MPVDPALRTLEIDLPARPQALVELSLLMAEEPQHPQRIAELVESDMALASAVMRAVNSALYGLRGRVQTVHQAVLYLGSSELLGIAYEIGLRAAFPSTAELEPIWARATLRGVLMGRLAALLGQERWSAHSAGLFEECGKAALVRHAPAHYPAMLRASQEDDAQLCQIERAGFGVSHDALGAALCESWGLAGNAVCSVRHHVQAQQGCTLPVAPPRRGVLALSVLAATLMERPDRIDDVALALAEPAGLDPTLLLRSVRRLAEQQVWQSARRAAGAAGNAGATTPPPAT